MKMIDFIFMAKRMVREYFNRYVCESEENKIVNIKEITTIKFYNTLESYKILLSTPGADKMLYEVSYNKNTNEIQSHAYN